VSIIGLIIMATLFVHELRFYLQTVTVHEVILLTTSLFPSYYIGKLFSLMS
jgi:hypothetical protein